MKKCFVAILLLYGFYSLAQVDTAALINSLPSDSTAIGSPDGQPVNKEIGTAGGSIVSDDGRVELIFPEGALTTDTKIIIQPTLNLAPNGVGRSYWFEPSGIQFKKPVQIIFHYTDEEAEACPPDWMSLGIQSRSGKWSFVNYESFDSTSKVLKGFIHHFSGASNINDIQLKPVKKEILVDTQVEIILFDISRFNTEMTAETGFEFEFALLPVKNASIWYVNKIPWGDVKNGQVNILTMPMVKFKSMYGIYLSPNIMPGQNPVKISVEIYRKRGKGFRKTVSCYIEIFDVYKVTVSHKFTPDLDARLGDGELLDSADCLVYFFPDQLKIESINNYSPELIKEGGYAGADLIGGDKRWKVKLMIHTDGAHGPIHLTKDIFNLYPPKNHPPELDFKLAQKKDLVVCRVQYVYRDIKGDRALLQIPYPWPIHIKFIANGQDQRYQVPIVGSTINSYMVRIERIKKE